MLRSRGALHSGRGDRAESYAGAVYYCADIKDFLSSRLRLSISACPRGTTSIPVMVAIKMTMPLSATLQHVIWTGSSASWLHASRNVFSKSLRLALPSSVDDFATRGCLANVHLCQFEQWTPSSQMVYW